MILSDLCEAGETPTETYTVTFTKLTPVQIKRLERALMFEYERTVEKGLALLEVAAIRNSPVHRTRVQTQLDAARADLRGLLGPLATQFPGLHTVIADLG